MSKEAKPYSYFASTDGEDVFDKMIHLLKPAVVLGIGLSMVDTMCLTYPKGYLATLGRYLVVTTPVVTTTATFVGVSNLSGSIRKKDDQYNWLLGGFAAGNVLGAHMRCYKVGTLGALALGLAALGVKMAHLNNYTLFQTTTVLGEGGALSHKQDWTLTKERPRNWTTGN